MSRAVPPQVPPGATIYSVAEAAGVSIATVSRVLAGSELVTERTRTKVLEAMERLDYLPRAAARSLAVRQHEALGLVLPELSGPYYSELLMGFEEVAADLDLGVVVAIGDTSRRGGGTQPFSRLVAGVDGVAVLGGAVPDAVLLRTSRQKPVVVVAGEGTADLEHLSAENTASAEHLTAHLVDVHGRRRLAFVGDPHLAPDVAQRYSGFVAALRGRGLDASKPLGGGLREADGLAVADLVLGGRVDADALVCANDELAVAVVARLTDAGRRVPGDVAVVGWDDIMAARYVRPGLTTVRQPVRELGARAAHRLHDRIGGAPAASDPVVLPTDLVLRGSCGCPDPGASTT